MDIMAEPVKVGKIERPTPPKTPQEMTLASRNFRQA